MPTVIRNSLLKMLFVLLLLTAMGVWQADFIVTAITANIFLNSCIIGTFSFGIYAALSRTIGLKNDIIAFRSLCEDYDDAVNPNEDNEGPTWRYNRCKEPAAVFYPPRILERPYTILSEEIASTRGLSMSTSAMQNLLDNVDEQLDEGRSLIAYVTGLLVFLGLIGTFIGLMVTLGSVGDIIGGLDLSGGAGAAAIQKLMDDLQIPLKGMATGFSSSLFGLITSLALGLVALFGNQAASKLKNEFGTWLAGVAKVSEQSEAQADGGDSVRERNTLENERMLSLMYRTAKWSIISNSRMVNTVETLAQASKESIEAQQNQHKDLVALSKGIASLSKSAGLTHQTLEKMAGLVEARDVLKEEVRRLQLSSNQNAQKLQTATEDFKRLIQRQNALQEQSTKLGADLARRDDLEKLSADTRVYFENEMSSLRNGNGEISQALDWLQTTVEQDVQGKKRNHHNLENALNELRLDLDWAIMQSRHAIKNASRASTEYQREDEEEAREASAVDRRENPKRGLLNRLRSRS